MEAIKAKVLLLWLVVMTMFCVHSVMGKWRDSDYRTTTISAPRLRAANPLVWQKIQGTCRLSFSFKSVNITSNGGKGAPKCKLGVENKICCSQVLATGYTIKVSLLNTTEMAKEMDCKEAYNLEGNCEMKVVDMVMKKKSTDIRDDNYDWNGVISDVLCDTPGLFSKIDLEADEPATQKPGHETADSNNTRSGSASSTTVSEIVKTGFTHLLAVNSTLLQVPLPQTTTAASKNNGLPANGQSSADQLDSVGQKAINGGPYDGLNAGQGYGSGGYSGGYGSQPYGHQPDPATLPGGVWDGVTACDVNITFKARESDVCDVTKIVKCRQTSTKRIVEIESQRGKWRKIKCGLKAGKEGHCMLPLNGMSVQRFADQKALGGIDGYHLQPACRWEARVGKAMCDNGDLIYLMNGLYGNYSSISECIGDDSVVERC